MRRVSVFLTILSVLLVANFANAQCSILGTAVQQTPIITGGNSYTKISVAYNATNNIYYTVNGSYVQVHSAASGGMITSYYYPNMRALWWNSNLGQLEGNSYGFGGTYSFALNSSGYPTSRTSIHSGYNQPNYNSVGAYDEDNNENSLFQLFVHLQVFQNNWKLHWF